MRTQSIHHHNTPTQQQPTPRKVDIHNVVAHIILFALIVYAVCSLALSIMVSTGWNAHWAVTHRAPFMVVWVDTVTIVEEDVDGWWGEDQLGRNTFYRSSEHNLELGQTKTSIFVYSPCNNYDDGIEWRLDL